MLTREQKRESLSLARMEYGDGDPWATTMSHMFAVADTLYHMDADIPPKWQYKHSPLCEGQLKHFAHPGGCADCLYPDTEYVPYMDAGQKGEEMLTYAGRVLDRYAGVLERHGWSY